MRRLLSSTVFAPHHRGGLWRTTSTTIGTTPPALHPALGAAFPSQAVRHFSKKDKKNTAAPAHHTAPHHKHAPSVGGTTHNEEPLVDLAKVNGKMERALTTLQKEFSGVRGGRPDASMFDHLYVQAYGKSTPLSEVAQVTIKSPTLAVINVYDPEVLPSVNEAIKTSKLELNPRVDGNVVSVPLPKPSAETRESYVKLVSQYTETARQNIRKVRREGLDKVRKGGGEGGKEGGGGVGEDEVRRNGKMIEAMTEEWVKKAGEMLERKKKEILTV